GDLLLETARAAIPEHGSSPGQIPQGRGMPFERTAGHAASLHLAIGEAFAALVAACAGQAAVDRQPRVVEQRLAKRTLRFGKRIVGRKRYGRGSAERCLERGEVVRRLRG